MPDHRASTTDHRTMSFEGGGACVLVDLDAGGRCASFVVDGRELLVGYRPERDPFLWGSYPMAPFAGRLRGGSLRFGGMTWQLPQNEAARHAIHGYAWAHPWRQLDERTLAVQIGEPWPFPGLLTQRIELGGDAVSFTLELRADVPMPAVLGWHPWFARRPRAAGPALAAPALARPEPGPAELSFHAGAMYLRDDDFIPTGRLVTPPAGPWVDCFTELDGPPLLRWPGFLELAVESSCADYVIYDEPEHAICVEPQTGPPDGPNIQPAIVTPERPLRASMTWRWRRLSG